MGGSVEVESEPGRGTTFRVRLPIGEASATAKVAPTRAVPGRRRVLVIDDDVLVATVMRRALAAEHDVTICGRAAEALAALKGGREFDVILCDMTMPGMGGAELYAAIERDLPRFVARRVRHRRGLHRVA